MSDLLIPGNSTPQEKALDGATSRISDIPVPVADVWNPDTCPEAMLPWLAWAYSVDTWDITWSEQQKRSTIKQSLGIHKTKGTIGAVREALDALGINAEIVEWFNQSPAGDPYTFTLQLESFQTPVDQAGIAAVLTVINRSKNLRSHLQETTVRALSESPQFVGAVTNIGNEITVLFDPG